MTSSIQNYPGKPARRKKCYAEADNAPGWLNVKTYVLAEPACAVTIAGAIQRIEVTSDSLLPYGVEVTSDCHSLAFGYGDGASLESRWTIQITMPSRPSLSNPQPEIVERKLRALSESPGGRVEVVAHWRCTTHPGAGKMDPFSIYIDTIF